MQDWLAEIEKEKNPALQAAVAARLAARLSPEDWALALRHLDVFSLNLTRTILEAAVVRRWARHDPEGAAAWGLAHSGVLAAVAAGEWVRTDAESATVWFESLTTGERTAHHLHEFYYLALLQQDRDAALASILAHANDPHFHMSWAEREMVAIAPEEFLDVSERLTNTGLRESIRAAVAREYGKRDPSSAVAWARRQPDADALLPAVFQQLREPPARLIPALAALASDEQKHILEKSWPWWERGDPFPTLEALRSAPSSLSMESRQHLVTRMMQAMTGHYDIAESVRRLESDWRDFAGLWERRVAAEWSRRDPDAARAWIETLPAGPLRDQALAAHAEAVKRRTSQAAPRDPAASTLRLLAQPPDHLEITGTDGFVRNTLRQLNTLDDSARRQLWERAADLPPDQKSRARASLVTFTAMTEPHQAAAWLQETPDASPDPALASRLAASWALDDATAAAQWTGALPEGEAKVWATWNLARQWHRVDASAVQRWAESQPPSTRAVVDRAVADQPPAPGSR